MEVRRHTSSLPLTLVIKKDSKVFSLVLRVKVICFLVLRTVSSGMLSDGSLYFLNLTSK
jgi:hypothetical protein